MLAAGESIIVIVGEQYQLLRLPVTNWAHTHVLSSIDFEWLNAHTSFDITIDSVVLADGTIRGSDSYQTAERLNAQIAAIQNLMQNIESEYENKGSSAVRALLSKILSSDEPPGDARMWDRSYDETSRTYARFFSEYADQNGIESLVKERIPFITSSPHLTRIHRKEEQKK